MLGLYVVKPLDRPDLDAHIIIAPTALQAVAEIRDCCGDEYVGGEIVEILLKEPTRILGTVQLDEVISRNFDNKCDEEITEEEASSHGCHDPVDQGTQ